MSLTYRDYLHLDELLRLQEPRSSPPEHDEMLFIVTHQTYELWFKELLFELDKIGRDFVQGELFAAIATWKRCRTIMKILVAQLDILETMTPLSFASFRERLDTASGFQSVQFRELEITLGYKRAQLVKTPGLSDADVVRLEQRLKGATLIDAFYRFLSGRGLSVPKDLLERDLSQPNQASEPLQEELLAAYKKQPDLVILFELMADFDEGLQEWRYRHIKLAERTIGAKRGTGGSYGIEFLKQSLFRPLFPDLWAVRHKM